MILYAKRCTLNARLYTNDYLLSTNLIGELVNWQIGELVN